MTDNEAELQRAKEAVIEAARPFATAFCPTMEVESTRLASAFSAFLALQPGPEVPK